MMHAMLQSHYTDTLIEAGCDEAGRGCLAGPVFAAAVILPRDFSNAILTDSKQLTEKQWNTPLIGFFFDIYFFKPSPRAVNMITAKTPIMIPN